MAAIIAEIVNAKSHVNFKLPELCLQPKKETLPVNKNNAEWNRDREISDGRQAGWRDDKREGKKGEKERIFGIPWI